jgi:hypothetical protein
MPPHFEIMITKEKVKNITTKSTKFTKGGVGGSRRGWREWEDWEGWMERSDFRHFSTLCKLLSATSSSPLPFILLRALRGSTSFLSSSCLSSFPRFLPDSQAFLTSAIQY